MFVLEFLGGPFDGFRYDYISRPRSLQKSLVWLVGEESWGPTDLPRNGRHGKLTSIALYSLDESSKTIRYRFAGCISPKDLLKPNGEMTTSLW
ncbi:MAG: hypothetical protein ABL921_06700 [Pirellula sp.]